jgi:hypothetical protein
MRQRLNALNRVIAIGRDTYLRLWPNPGVGLCFGTWRLGLSWRGGLEVFEKHPAGGWRRTRAWLSRVKRPGGKV